MYENQERILLTDCKFSFEERSDLESDFSKIELINELHIASEDGYNKTLNDKIDFFESIIENQ